MTEIDGDLAGLLEANRHAMANRRLHPANAPIRPTWMAHDDTRLKVTWFHSGSHGGTLAAALFRVNSGIPALLRQGRCRRRAGPTTLPRGMADLLTEFHTECCESMTQLDADLVQLALRMTS